MVLDPNWGTNLFRTYQDARRSRFQEQEAADEAVTRGLQRQQIQSGIARQAKQDAADEEAAAEIAMGGAAQPMAPVASPRPTKTPPDALSGGGIPGVTVDPALKGRAKTRELIQPAMEDAIVKKVTRDPSFYAKMIQTAPLMAPSLQAKLYRAGHKEFVLRARQADAERAMKAPLDAFNLQRDVEKDDLAAESTRHTMKHQNDTLAATKAHYGAIESSNNRDFELRKAKQAHDLDPARFNEQLFRDAAQAGYKVVQEGKRGEIRGIIEDKREQGRTARASAVNEARKAIEADKQKFRATENEKDRTMRTTMNKDRIKAAIAHDEGTWKSNQLIAEARNRVNILINNAKEQGLSARQLEHERDIFARQMVESGEVSEESAFAAFDVEFDPAWIGEGSIKVPPRGGPPIIDRNAGNVRPRGKNATMDDIDAALSKVGG